MNLSFSKEGKPTTKDRIILDQNIYDNHSENFYKNLYSEIDLYLRRKPKEDKATRTFSALSHIELSRFSWKKLRLDIEPFKATKEKDLFIEIFDHFNRYIGDKIKDKLLNSIWIRLNHLKEISKSLSSDSCKKRFFKHEEVALRDYYNNSLIEGCNLKHVIQMLSISETFVYYLDHQKFLKDDEFLDLLKGCLSIFQNSKGGKVCSFLKVCRPTFAFIDDLLSKGVEKQRQILGNSGYEAKKIEKIISFLNKNKDFYLKQKLKNLYSECRIQKYTDLVDMEFIHQIFFGTSSSKGQSKAYMYTLDETESCNKIPDITRKRIKIYKRLFNILDLFSDSEKAPETPYEFKELSLFKGMRTCFSEINILDKEGKVRDKITSDEIKKL